MFSGTVKSYSSQLPSSTPYHPLILHSVSSGSFLDEQIAHSTNDPALGSNVHKLAEVVEPRFVPSRRSTNDSG